MTEFTYAEYGSLLDRFLSQGYEFRSFDDEITDGTVLLRHDVDWSPERARLMASIEADHGVSSTYFFLVTSPFYNVLYEEARDAIADIEELGHDVGVHFSTHQYWRENPGPDAVNERVRTEQDVLSTVTDDLADAVSFHIPPDWVLEKEYDEFTNTYAPRYLEEIAYNADSNQRWRDDPPFDGPLPERNQILVHPGVWASEDQEFDERLENIRESRFTAVRTYLDRQFISEVH